MIEKTDLQKPANISKKKTEQAYLPQYKVILHNDDINEMGYVVRVIYRLTPLSYEEAYRKMLEAHITGAAILLYTHKERAELYKEQFQSAGLTVTIEPAE